MNFYGLLVQIENAVRERIQNAIFIFDSAIYCCFNLLSYI